MNTFKLVAIVAMVLMISSMIFASQYNSYDEYEYEYDDYEYDEIEAQGTSYTVRSGDTLSGIASRYPPCTVSAIASANGIANINLIRVGQVLQLPCAGGSPSPTPTPTPSPSGGVVVPVRQDVYFKQCDSRYGSARIGSSNVCNIGCLVSSVAVGLRARNIKIAGQDSTPATLANFCTAHGGFSGNLFIHGIVTKISGRSSYLGQSQLNWSQISQKMNQGIHLVCAINGFGHWMSVYGYSNSDKSIVYVRDSAGTDRKTYPISGCNTFAQYSLA